MENGDCKDLHDNKADLSERDGDAAIANDKLPANPAEGEDRYSEKEPSLAQSLN